ncbi:MAG: nuclear transport factor 2 family protein [Chitinophagaceae bacterium]|nr:nuclear transport factor 2 family protein [Chitinophagaceae bacterium]
MKKTILFSLLMALSFIIFAQDKKTEEVKKTLAAYKLAMEKLDKDAMKNLFAEDAMVYENGDPGDKAADFLKEHMYPEFDMFSSFTYDSYKSDIIVSGDYAYTTETFNYTIVLKKDGKPIVPSSMGVATAVLKKTSSGWKIISYHSSYRKQKPAN